MKAHISSKENIDNEPISDENDSLRILMLMQKRKRKELKHKRGGKMQDELYYTSLHSQKGILELSLVSIVLTLLVIGYTIWKDQRNSSANHSFKDTVVMKDLILNQIVHAQ